jgi:hypothetical protein
LDEKCKSVVKRVEVYNGSVEKEFDNLPMDQQV